MAIDHTKPERMALGYRGIDIASRQRGASADDEHGAPSDSPPPLAPNLPGYENLTPLHSSNANVVYKAMDAKNARWVAIDVPTPARRRNEVAAARFQAEAATLAKLRHPNLSQIYEFGENESGPYLVQEFVEGGSLSLYAKAVRLSKQEIAALMEPIARGVQVIHDHGIIHRDLKPSNVLVTADGIPKIADFGLAVHFAGDSPVTADGRMIGTTAYMAPERAHPKVPLSTAVDIYSLGAILFEILADRPPVIGNAPMDTAMKAKTLEVQSPRQVDPTVPLDLEAICMKCLRRDPRERYQSANAVADDLRRFVSGEPIQARSIGSIERTIKWSKRKPLIAGLSIALIALIVLDIAGMWILYRRAAEGERDAVQTLELMLSNPAIAEQLKTDPKFARMRDRPEFKKSMQTKAQ